MRKKLQCDKDRSAWEGWGGEGGMWDESLKLDDCDWQRGRSGWQKGTYHGWDLVKGRAWRGRLGCVGSKEEGEPGWRGAGGN